jgi:hypothetical protein
MNSMRARLYKEAREVCPFLLGALALIQTPYLIWGHRVEEISISILGLGCLMLAAIPFGHEFQYRTTTLLLAQPIARRAIWRDKLLVLGTALSLSTLLLWWNILYFSVPLPGIVFVLIPLCAFCGGPWLTLLLRSGIAGAAATALVPAALVATITLILNLWYGHDDGPISGELIARVIITCLFVYCAAAFCLGYVTFRRFQVIDRASRELALPVRLEAWLSRALGGVSERFHGPIAALVKKELHLHQIAFLVAGILMVVLVAGALLAYAHKTVWSQTIVACSAAIYLPVLPFLVGGMSTAEERGWGISQWHLSLPPSMARQWRVKSAMALGVSAVLGVVLPGVLYLLFAYFHLNSDSIREFMQMLPGIVLGELLLVSLASYAGTFTSSTLRAILLAFGMVLAFGCWMRLIGSVFSSLPPWLRDAQVPPPPPIGGLTPDQVFACFIYLGMFLLLVLFQGFAFSNFKRGESSARRFLCQFGTVLGATIFYPCVAAILLLVVGALHYMAH